MADVLHEYKSLTCLVVNNYLYILEGGKDSRLIVTERITHGAFYLWDYSWMYGTGKVIRIDFLKCNLEKKTVTVSQWSNKSLSPLLFVFSYLHHQFSSSIFPRFLFFHPISFSYICSFVKFSTNPSLLYPPLPQGASTTSLMLYSQRTISVCESVPAIVQWFVSQKTKKQMSGAHFCRSALQL